MLCVTDIFSKYARDKKGVTVAKTFQKTLGGSSRKPNKIYVDKGSKFYNRSMKTWLQDNDKEMHLAHNKEKSVASQKFITILKNKF